MSDAETIFHNKLEKCTNQFPIRERRFTNKKGERDTSYVLDDKDMNYVIDINNELCDYLSSPNEDNKNKLFKTLYSLMLYRCGTRWKIILDKTVIDHPRLGEVYVQNLKVLESIFYTRSKWFEKEQTILAHVFQGTSLSEIQRLRLNSDFISPIPSKLFLEFILFVVRNVKHLSDHGHFFSVFLLGNWARKSDQQAILYNAFELDSFIRISRESDVSVVINSIQEVYKKCGFKFKGNLSLSHLVGEICENIIKKNTTSRRQSQQRSRSRTPSPSPSPSLKMRSQEDQIKLDYTISPSNSFELKHIPKISDKSRARSYGGSKCRKTKYTHSNHKRSSQDNTRRRRRH
jgi:hypothetical protein